MHCLLAKPTRHEQDGMYPWSTALCLCRRLPHVVPALRDTYGTAGPRGFVHLSQGTAWSGVEGGL